MGAKEDFEEFTSFFSEKLGLEGKNLEKFVNDAMSHKGHTPKMIWDDAVEETDNTSNIFGGSGSKRTRNVDEKTSKKTGTFGGMYDE